ncbi:YobA family protein [Lysinibacillus xylanilyticus]|uniref:YobA family protein n=1 Tax=Lysinibacillus xylanilyticus TaxID=582475 RepID=UPI002B251360|nr:YobA family protein [Lysinibacillus xylanilyticus]MEB2281034.1 YobA family protein [Lysinibacillus xylanilyticus]
MKTQLKMKKRLVISMLLITGLVTCIIGCSKDTTNNAELTMEGIVAKIKDNQILVVKGVTKEEIKGLSEVETVKKAQSAAYFELKREVKNMKVGSKVKVWIESIDTSNPAYGISSKVEVIN